MNTGAVLDSQNVSAPSFISHEASPQLVQPEIGFVPEVIGFHQDGGISRTITWAAPIGPSTLLQKSTVGRLPCLCNTDTTMITWLRDRFGTICNLTFAWRLSTTLVVMDSAGQQDGTRTSSISEIEEEYGRVEEQPKNSSKRLSRLAATLDNWRRSK